MAKDLDSGVCENCGTLGLAGERCPCGGIFVDVSADAEDAIVHQDDDIPHKPEDPETYPLDLVDSMEDDELVDEKL